MSASFRVISIGTLASNPHWGERGAVRPPHATTTLITSGKAKILVDPSLPAQVLIQRLVERSGISPDEITHVFLTCLNPIHRRGLLAFERAQWLVSEREREAIGGQLVASIKEAHSAGDATPTGPPAGLDPGSRVTASDYRPPRWLRSPHVQSVLGSSPLRRRRGAKALQDTGAVTSEHLIDGGLLEAVE